VVQNDSCNPLSGDAVEITTSCLTVRATGSYSVTPASATTPVSLSLSANGTTSGTNTTLYFGWRVKSRPTLPMGDQLKTAGGSYAMDVPAWQYQQSAACLLDPTWNIATETGAANPGAWPMQTFNPKIKGAYTFFQFVTDGCGYAKTTEFSYTVSCTTALTLSTVAVTATTGTITWNGGSFDPFVFTAAANPASAVSVNPVYAWFLTSKAAGSSKPLYNASAASPGSMSHPACTAGGSPLVIDTNSALYTSGSGAPFSRADTNAAPTFVADMEGVYELTLQVSNECDAMSGKVTLQANCNAKPRFIAGDGTASSATAVAAFNGPTVRFCRVRACPRVCANRVLRLRATCLI
jgi:hypothetical protein